MVSQASSKGLEHAGGGARATPKSVERIQPEHLRLENCAEIAGDGFGDGVEVNVAVQFPLHRRDWLAADATWDDQVEAAEVGIHVQGKAVGCDEAGDVDADRSEFGFGFVAPSG